jgi:hypothetical protein
MKMLDTNLLPYPWHIIILSLVGLVVVCAVAYYVLQIVWAFVKATIQAFIYQLFSYKKAKINGRPLKWNLFWESYREMWFFLLGSDYSKDPIRRGNSYFYGWTFTVRKDSQFVPTDEVPDPNDYDPNDPDDEDDDLAFTDENDKVIDAEYSEVQTPVQIEHDKK